MAPATRRRILAGLLIASMALNIAFVALLASTGGYRRILLRLGLAKPPSLRAPFQIEDEERFRLLQAAPGGVVFAGDSLVAAGPWAELYSAIHNRGIGGDRTDNVLDRLGEVLASRPRKLVFLIGSNDLSAAVPPSRVVANYRAILGRVATECPEARVAVIGLLPVNPAMEGSPAYSNRDVAGVNKPLRRLVGEFPNARFLDVSGRVADDNGVLRPEYSKDGLHLNIKGYLAIEPDVRAFLGET